MATLRLHLKNLRALYSIRLPRDPEYARIVALAREPYDTVRNELSTLIDAVGDSGEDVPVEDVRQLSLKLGLWGSRSTRASILDDGKHPGAVQFARLGAILQGEVYQGAATALGLLTDMYDPNHASEQDLEEYMAREWADEVDE